MKLYTLENSVITQKDKFDFKADMYCDILVVGAGSSGIYAAFAARREGADVILIENDSGIGGMHVQGNVHGYYYGAKGGTYEDG